MNLSPLSKRRIENFRSNKRGFYSAIIFVFLFVITIFAEFIANDKPILVVFDNKFYFPVIEKIPETFLVVNLKLNLITKILLFKS